MPPAPGYAAYLSGLKTTFRDYLHGRFPVEAIDGGVGEGLVFAQGHELLNLVEAELGYFLPPERRHLWFRSLSSSQALTLSVLGTLARRGDLGLLASLRCDDNLPLLAVDGDFWFYCFEFTPWWLERGRRKSQIDLYLVSDTARIAVECKLTETDIGVCDPMQPGKSFPAYSSLAGYDICSRVSQNGARYWHYWSEISDFPLPESCPDRCPLYLSYQLARNIMAAAVNPTSDRVDGKGAALLIYDARNPSFGASRGAPDILSCTRGILSDASLLRSSTWQSLTRLLGSVGGYEDLLVFLKDKYGIVPGDPPRR